MAYSQRQRPLLGLIVCYSYIMKTIAVIGIRGLPGIQGGVEMHSENLYPLMQNVSLRVYRRKPYLTELSHKHFGNIEFVDLPSTRIKGFEAVFHTLLCVIHILFHRPDYVHIHNIGPGMFAPLLRIAGIKTVMTYHSPNYEHKKWGFIARNILRFSEFLSLNSVNKVIFVNKFQMAKYSDRIQQKSIFIPNGIVATEPTTATSFIEQIGIKPNEYILAVGRLTPEKGFEHLVEAVNQIDDVKHLVIAGACDHDAHYFNLLKSLDTHKKVVFTGFTFGNNLAQLYSHARMYVLSSVNEGFPLVLLEAMNYSLPIVATDIPATHLIELPAESYVEKANPQSLALGIQQMLKNPIGRIHYDLSEYNWHSIANQTLQTIQSI